MSPGRVWAIAINATKEALRNRAFLGLMILAMAFLLFSMALAELAVRGEAARVVLDFGYFALSLFGVVIAIVMGVILVYKEVDKKTIFTIIPKPVHRYEFILGKYLGMLAMLVVEVGVMAAVWMLVLASKDAPIDVGIAQALVLIFVEIMVVLSIAVLFSAFSSPILSGVFTLGIFVMGRTAYIVAEMVASKKGLFASPTAETLGTAYTHICPDLNVFNISQDLLLGIEVPWSYVAASTGYGLAYVVFFLAAAMLLFMRRDFI
jgi:ABC-type transport system involved in multi-copper enzyme maturation permease subunit